MHRTATMNLVNRINRVPVYQRHYQKHDGVRLWWKGPHSSKLLYPYFAFLGIALAGSTYGIVRMAFGHRTWFGKN